MVVRDILRPEHDPVRAPHPDGTADDDPAGGVLDGAPDVVPPRPRLTRRTPPRRQPPTPPPPVDHVSRRRPSTTYGRRVGYSCDAPTPRQVPHTPRKVAPTLGRAWCSSSAARPCGLTLPTVRSRTAIVVRCRGCRSCTRCCWPQAAKQRGVFTAAQARRRGAVTPPTTCNGCAGALTTWRPCAGASTRCVSPTTTRTRWP